MKKFIIIFCFTFIISSFAFAQRLRYEICSNCPSSSSSMTVPSAGFSYSGTKVEMSSQNVASDFGRRASNSLWHLGVDFSSQPGDDDVGDKIYSVETGTVIKIKGDGTYKVLVIEGANRFGYGHIFFNEVPDVALGSRSGDFILKKMDSPQANYYSIIYAPKVGTATAIGEVAGKVTHADVNNGFPITVSSTITSIDNPIAPVGNSGNAVGAAHIHFYNFQNDPVDNDFNSSYPGVFNTTYFRNPKNPLQFLLHSEPTYLLTFPNDINLTYPGNSRSSIKVRGTMNGSTAGSNYSNAVMDVEDVELFIKKKSEPASAYKLFKGPVLESKISYGGRVDSNRYPSINFPTNNTGTNAIDIAKGVSDDIDQGIGNATRTGILPFAYSTQPYDEFFFSDIFTRIHKDDNFGGATAKFAAVNEEARYSDGAYKIYSKLTTITNVEHNSESSEIIIDDFRPYIKEIIIRKNGPEGKLSYRGYWNWNPSTSQLAFVPETFNDLGPADNVWIKIIASEPIQNLKYNEPTSDGTRYWDIDEALPNTDNKEFVILHGPISTLGTRTLNISAEDLSGNALQVNPAQIPIRQANGAWSPTPTAGVDSNHKFNVGTGVCTGGSGGRVAQSITTTSTSCLYADVSVDKVNAEINEIVKFTPVTSGNGLLTYNWNFGTGAVPATSTSSGAQSVLYKTAGAKTVTLEICDNTAQCITKTKVGIVTVGQPPVNNVLTVDFSTNRYGANINQDINLTSIVTGAKGAVSYAWDFGDVVTKGYFSDVNPIIAYTSPGYKTIQLTVTDANGSVTKIRNNYLIINSPYSSISVTITGCGPISGTGVANFSRIVSGGSPPYYSYLWDFGDGTKSTSSSSVSHTYKKSGKYTVKLRVCDETGCGLAVSTDCISVPTSIDSKTLAPDFFVDNLPVTASPTIVRLNTPVKFTNATTGGGDPSAFTYSWDFQSHYFGGSEESATPETNIRTGPAAQEVYYTTTGRKEVSLIVDNGLIARRKTIPDAIEVRAGLGSGTCYAIIGDITLSSTCWTASKKPKFTVPISGTNCPIAKTEVMLNGYVLPGGVIDFVNFLPSKIPTFPFVGNFTFTIYQSDGVSLNRIGYKTQKFTIYGPVIADAGVDKQVCMGSSIEVGSAPVTEMSYQWSSTTAPVNLLSNLNIANPVFNAVQKGTFVYRVKVTNKLSGCTSYDDVSITVDNPETVPSIIYTTLAKATPLTITEKGGFGSKTYFWSPADKLNSTTVASPIFTATTEGDFSYMTIVTDQNGCQTSCEVYVNVSSAPANLQAKAESYSRISLTWVNRNPNETGFVIQRSIGNNSNFIDYSIVGQNITFFEDNNVEKGTLYFYRVAAIVASNRTEYIVTSINTESLPIFSPISLPYTDFSNTLGDFDNDGDLDLVTSGINVIKFYRNENGLFSIFYTMGFSGERITMKVADLNNDGKLDVYSTPISGSSKYTSFIFLNNGTGFDRKILNKTHCSQMVTIDWDNNNTVDLLLKTNSLEYGYVYNMFRYTHNAITNDYSLYDIDIPVISDFIPFVGLSFSDMMVSADLDNNGSQDIVFPDSQGSAMLFYPSIGNSFSRTKYVKVCPYPVVEEFVPSKKFVGGGIDIADIDSNGFLDLLIAGQNSTDIYLNKGSTFTKIDNFNISEELKDPQIQASDFDMDGDLDFFVSNFETDFSNNAFICDGKSYLFRNDNGKFNQVLTFAGSDVFNKWVDIDGDGDLDIFGTKGVVYLNNLGTNKFIKNIPPSPPSNLCVYFNGSKATFTWDGSTDSKTSQLGLTYNLYVKQNGVFILSPMADLTTGLRKVQKRGNVDQNTSWTLDLPNSSNIEWGVQAIDNSYAGSNFATSTVPDAGSIAIAQTCTNLASLTNITPGSGGNYQWQNSTDGNNWSNIPGATGSTYTTTILSTTYYRRKMVATICSTGYSNAVTITPPPTAGTINTPAPICEGSSVTLSGSDGTGGTYQWQIYISAPGWLPYQSSPTTPSPTTPSITVTNLSSTYSFRRNVVSSSGCGTANGSEVVVTVDPTPVAGSISTYKTPICSTQPTLISGTLGSGGTYQWESSPDSNFSPSNIIAGATSVDYTTSGSSTTTYYRRKIVTRLCTSVNSNTVTAIAPPTAGTVTASLPASPDKLVTFSGSAIDGATYLWWVDVPHAGWLQADETPPSTSNKGQNYTTTLSSTMTFRRDVTNACGTAQGMSVQGGRFATNEQNEISSTIEGYSLDQNVPNPTESFTVINYNTPVTATEVKIIIMDIFCKGVSQHTLPDHKGSLKISTAEMPAGMYIYSLVVNGNLMKMKKMLVVK